MATHLQLQSSSPNKRPKTLNPDPPSPPSSISKGKSKVEEQPLPPVAENGSADCCGICLSESGASRGYIDCCNHYYCFVCIMEWAKVESKCPLCKRRFSTIRRPPKPPVFASERVVHIPVRDQVCHHFGNATIGPSDLYSEVKCGICEGIADEGFLLLCDLCDSAAHTYCVGLGHTVPEGDWFCQDCSLLRDEHLRSESNIDSDVVEMTSSSAYKASTVEHISISDIIQDSRGHAVRKTGTASSDYFPLSTSTDNVVFPVNGVHRFSSTSPETVVQPNARTLRHCRNLHDRIRVLRKNWNGFQSGVLHFSSDPGESNISRKSTNVRSGEYSVGCSNQKETIQCSSSNVKNDTSRDHEIQKAWEMFDKAKSIKQNRERSNTMHPASKCQIRKLNPIRSEKDCYEQPLRPSEETISRRMKLQAKETLERAHFLGSDASRPVVSNVDRVNGVNHASSSHSNIKHTKEKRKSEKIYVDNQQYNDAKSEIQSLVKLNLKLQTKEEKLEVDVFKEVARVATHSILATCGLEQPRPSHSSIPLPICSHLNESRLHQKCSFMPCCRECFYVFVKNIVDNVLLQKKRT